MQQHRFLRYVADHAPPCFHVELLERHAVDQDLTATRPDKADHEIDDGRLARSRGSIDRADLVGWDFHVEPEKNLVPLIEELHIAQRDACLECWQGLPPHILLLRSCGIAGLLERPKSTLVLGQLLVLLLHLTKIVEGTSQR